MFNSSKNSRVPINVFRSNVGRDKNLATAFALREDYTNLTGAGVSATAGLIFDCEINGVYGIMVAHNGNAFENETAIIDSLHFNTSNGDDGVQGGGMKAATAIMSQPKKGTEAELHVASKTHETGLVSKVVLFTRTTRTGVSELYIDDSVELSEKNLRNLFGDEYDDFTNFFFRPMEKKVGTQEKQWIWHKFNDLFGIVIDGLPSSANIYTIVRKASHTVTKGNLAWPSDNGGNSTDLYRGSKVERVLIISRSEKMEKLPGKPRISCSDEISIRDVDGNDCKYEIVFKPKLGLKFQKSTTKSERMLVAKPDGALEIDQNTSTVDNVRVMMATTNSGTNCRQLDRIYSSPLNADKYIEKIFRSEAGIFTPKNGVIDGDKIKSLFEEVYPNKNAAAEIARLGITSCRPILDVTITINPLNRHAENQFGIDCMDILFLVDNEKVAPLIRQATKQIISNNDDMNEFVKLYREYFHDKQDSGFAVLDVSTKQRENPVDLIAERCSGEYPLNIIDGHVLSDTKPTLPGQVYFYTEGRVPFRGKAIPDTVSRGFSVFSGNNPRGAKGRKFTIILDGDVDKADRVNGCLQFRDEDQVLYRVKGLMLDAIKRKKTELKDPKVPNPKPTDADDQNIGKNYPYVDFDDPKLVGVFIKGKFQFNEGNAGVIKVFKGSRNATGVLLDRGRIYTKISDLASKLTAAMDVYDGFTYSVDRTDLADEMSENAMTVHYVINETLRIVFDEQVAAFCKKYGEFPDDMGEAA